MKWIKLYEDFEDDISIERDVQDIFIELEDEGFKVEITFWVNGARGGYLISDEKGVQRYGPIANDGKLYLKVEIKRLKTTGESLFKMDGFNWIETKHYFGRLKDFLEKYSPVKYKIKSMVFSHVPRFSIMRETELVDSYQTSFDYVDSKYIEKDFTDRNTLTSVSYFFERL
jgi:hypothetical protein